MNYSVLLLIYIMFEISSQEEVKKSYKENNTDIPDAKTCLDNWWWSCWF